MNPDHTDRLITSERIPTQPSPSAQIVRRLFYDNQHYAHPAHPEETSPSVASAKAPVLSHSVLDTSFPICAEEFFENNPLIAATLQPRTQQEYAVALENFRTSTFATTPHDLPLDHRLSMYIQGSYVRNPNSGNRQEMGNLLSIIDIMYPSLRGDNLGLAERCIAGWRALDASKCSAPFTKDISFALACRMLVRRRIDAALTIIMTFCAGLRVSEALSLNVQDIALPGDPRLSAYDPHVAGINVRDANTARYTGRLQFVKLEDPHAIKLLQAWKASLKRDTGPLVTLTYETYTADLKAALSSLRLQNKPFTSLSARIGKATHDYIAGLPVSQIAVDGRWKSINSLRYYVTNGRAWLLDNNISREAQHSIDQAANGIRSSIDYRPSSA